MWNRFEGKWERRVDTQKLLRWNSSGAVNVRTKILAATALLHKNIQPQSRTRVSTDRSSMHRRKKVLPLCSGSNTRNMCLPNYVESQPSVQSRIWVPQISHETYLLHIPHLASKNLRNFHSVVFVLFSVGLYPVSFRTSLQHSQVKSVTVDHGHFPWNANTFTIHDHLATTIDAVIR